MEYKSKIESLMKKTPKTRLDIECYTNEINEILIMAAKISVPYKRRVSRQGKTRSKALFDDEFNGLYKKSVTSIATALQINPFNTQLWKIYFQTLTKYNRSRKKRQEYLRLK